MKPARLIACATAALSLSSACRWRSRELPRLAELPEFRLTAVAAKGPPQSLTGDALRGRVWIADFVFTSCAGPCPLLTTKMAELQKALPDGVALVSFTVDPDEDSPERLQRYARRFGADPGRWRFATGDKAGLYRLLREGFKLAVVEDPSAPEGRRVTHSTKFVLVDSSMTVRGYYDGQDAQELAGLQRDAASLLTR